MNIDSQIRLLLQQHFNATGQAITEIEVAWLDVSSMDKTNMQLNSLRVEHVSRGLNAT
jgi:hypothetical protein